MGNVTDDVKGIAPLPGGPRDVVILGSGLNEAGCLDAVLKSDWREHECTFDSVGIQVGSVPNHANTIVASIWAKRPVLVSRGRVHLYQVLKNPSLFTMLRQWMGVLMHASGGGTRWIIVNAVGGLVDGLSVGTVVVPGEFIAYHFPSALYLDGARGEFPASESLLPEESSPFFRAYLENLEGVGLRPCTRQAVRYIPVVGPRFGGKGERDLFGSVFCCQTVGMSLLPELDLIAVENLTRPPGVRPIRVGPLQLVTDNCDAPSDSGVKDEAKKAAPKVLKLISRLLATEW